MALQLSRRSHLGLAKEVTHGTYLAPTVFIPVMSPKPKDVPEYLHDESIRANTSVLQGSYQGVKHSTFGWEALAYPDVLGHALVAMLGQDTVTPGVSTTLAASTIVGATQISTVASIPEGSTIRIDVGGLQEIRRTGTPSGAGPFTIPIVGAPLAFAHNSGVAVVSDTSHRFTAAWPPPSFSITDFTGFEARGYPGSRMSELTLKVDAKGIVSYDAAWVGFPSASQGTPTPVFSERAPLLGWQWTLDIAGVPVTRGLSLELAIKRETEAIFGSTGQQEPKEVFGGDLEAEAKVSFIYEDNTERARVFDGTQPVLVATLAQSDFHGGANLIITGSKSSWEEEDLDRGDRLMKLSITVPLVHNTTDAGPAAIVLTNDQAAAY